MQWTPQRVAHTLDEFRRIKRDSTDIDVKRASQLPENLPETVCAFANMPGGGTIILGVDERANFAVVGVPNPQGLFNKIVNQTRASVRPAPQLAHKVLTEGKEVLVIDVSALPLSERPARHRNKAYLRQSDGDYVMNDADLALIDIQNSVKRSATVSIRPPFRIRRLTTSIRTSSQSFVQTFAARAPASPKSSAIPNSSNSSTS